MRNKPLRLIALCAIAICSSGQAIAQSASPDLFGIFLSDQIQNYSADLYSAEVDTYAGPPFMTVDIAPPVRNNNFSNYFVSYDTRNGSIAQITAFEPFADLNTCAVAANSLSNSVSQKYNIMPVPNDFVSGVTRSYGFLYPSEAFIASVTCLVYGGADVSLLVDLRTHEYDAILTAGGNQF